MSGGHIKVNGPCNLTGGKSGDFECLSYVFCNTGMASTSLSNVYLSVEGVHRLQFYKQ